VSVLDNLKGKRVEIKVRELSSFYGRLVGFDDQYIIIETTKTEQNKTTTKTYYIPHYNIIYISPA
jgi:small nuclear ribonucleoprotein (snRNP)-like protein